MCLVHTGNFGIVFLLEITISNADDNNIHIWETNINNF